MNRKFLAFYIILYSLFTYCIARHTAIHVSNSHEAVTHKHEEPGKVSRIHEFLDNIANKIVEHYIPLQKSFEEKWPLWVRLFLVFFAGILVGLTPCIYPLIPVVAGIIIPQNQTASWLSNFFHTFSYVLGLATSLSVLGYLTARLSLEFGVWLNNPLFLAFVIIFILYLALAQFGFYQLYIPSILLKARNIKSQGSSLYNFLMGIVSGFVASPCATPALIFMLAYVAKIANPFEGFIILFVYTFGFCALLILIGTFSNILSLLPSGGLWMSEAERVVGFMLLGLIIYIADPLISSFLSAILYSILVMGMGTYYLFTSKTKGRIIIAKILLGIVLLIISLTIFLKTIL